MSEQARAVSERRVSKDIDAEIMVVTYANNQMIFGKPDEAGRRAIIGNEHLMAVLDGSFDDDQIKVGGDLVFTISNDRYPGKKKLIIFESSIRSIMVRQ